MASFPADACSATELVAGADAALYAAKAPRQGPGGELHLGGARAAGAPVGPRRRGGVARPAAPADGARGEAQPPERRRPHRRHGRRRPRRPGRLRPRRRPPARRRRRRPRAGRRCAVRHRRRRHWPPSTAAASGRTVNAGDAVGEGGEPRVGACGAAGLRPPHDRRPRALPAAASTASPTSPCGSPSCSRPMPRRRSANARLLASQRRATAVAEALLGIATAASRETVGARGRAADRAGQPARSTGAASASVVVADGSGRRQRVLAAHGQPGGAVGRPGGRARLRPASTGVTVLRSRDLPAVSAEAARRHAHVATAPVHGGWLTVVVRPLPADDPRDDRRGRRTGRRSPSSTPSSWSAAPRRRGRRSAPPGADRSTSVWRRGRGRARTS